MNGFYDVLVTKARAATLTYYAAVWESFSRCYISTLPYVAIWSIAYESISWTLADEATLKRGGGVQ